MKKATKEYLADAARYRKKYGIDVRRAKKMERFLYHPLYEAYILGDEAASMKNPRPNPYPPGKRHAEFERGKSDADPMGDWQRSNR